VRTSQARRKVREKLEGFAMRQAVRTMRHDQKKQADKLLHARNNGKLDTLDAARSYLKARNLGFVEKKMFRVTMLMIHLPIGRELYYTPDGKITYLQRVRDRYLQSDNHPELFDSVREAGDATNDKKPFSEKLDPSRRDVQRSIDTSPGSDPGGP
jgi:hypothetical protein